MNGSKDWYASTTVWGSIIAIAATVAGLMGHEVAPADQQILIQALTAIGTGIGGIVALIGRMRATTTISGPTKGN